MGISSSKVYKQADEAAAFAHIRELAEKEPVDDETASELWLEAEAIVDTYIEAAESRSIEDLPSRQELGESCFWLLFQTKVLREDEHYRLIVELLSPQLGLSLFDLLPLVRKLREAALDALESMVKTPSMDRPTAPQACEDDLF